MNQAKQTVLKLPVKPAVKGEKGRYQPAPGDKLMEAQRRDKAKDK